MRTYALAFTFFLAACSKNAPQEKVVNWGMWQGDPYINAYVRDFVTPQLKDRYGITLNIVGAQGNNLVGMLMAEKEAGKADSALDLMWINGETFYQLRQIDALYGPFADKLENAKYVDFANPFVRYDFRQETNGYECPWGNVQLAIIYDSAKVDNPPRTRADLVAWVKEHPGRFTFDNGFTGMTLLKGWLIDLMGGQSFDGQFDEAKYAKASAELWAWVNSIKPYLWNKGESFPADVAALHQLYAGGNIDFTMSNNDGEVDNKVLQGLFPKSSKAYVFDSGTIQNSHFVGIPKGSPHKEAAMQVANFLISPEAQFEKLKPQVWGDGTILDVSKLPADWQDKFAHVPQRERAPLRSEIQPHALQEPAAEYMVRVFKDFRTHVIEAH